MKARIEVSPEMVAFVGDGPVPAADWPADAVGFGYRVAPATFFFHPCPTAADLGDADIAFVVAAEACDRVFDGAPALPGLWHLPSDMRVIALAIQQCRLPSNAATTLRVAKCIELLCVTFEKLGEATLVAADGAGALSAAEAQRIADARRLIDERWNEKLTLDTISRACGLNRAKLTRGFRSMFAMSVADAITDRRLGGARDLLLATDLPVSSIGYRCGYLNNASFTRAFSRRFGQAPTQFRNRQLAA
ncbi:AraC family transcriptional activator of pyochelin receptor [Sphingomonas insulae]|uniref:HTH araC/xylS-type domain-containing protein n=1 Tax=Sphingomonas insulae TaxID=424800 RepID=A0ABN1HY50_9SPHN|nr:AraC family transcriptional regulator [Sphingomonas insulae]NIJ29670.1 AraC family transcriptional activator of pyochelin receptor [Sphingomonas insulae]